MAWGKRWIGSFLANRLDTEALIRRSGSPLIFPLYHTVSDDYLPHIGPLYTPKTVDGFRCDLDFLLRHFRPVSMNEARAHIRKEKIVARPAFHLTFDDGLREVYDIVFPLLREKGVPFTVFVNSAFVDNRDLFFRHKSALLADRLRREAPARSPADVMTFGFRDQDRLDATAKRIGVDFSDFLKTRRPYLSTDELKEMTTGGATIGGHGVDHRPYADLSEEEQARQTLESCAFVRERFGERRAYFAFPFTDQGVPDGVFSRIYPRVDLTFGIGGIYFRRDGRHVGRIDMEKYGKDARECINKAFLTAPFKK